MKHGVACGAPAEVNRDIVIRDGGERRDHVTRRVAPELLDQHQADLRIATLAHGDRRQTPDGGRRIGEPVAQPVAAHPRRIGQREGGLAHRGVAVADKRRNEPGGQGKPGIGGGPQGGRQQRIGQAPG